MVLCFPGTRILISIEHILHGGFQGRQGFTQAQWASWAEETVETFMVTGSVELLAKPNLEPVLDAIEYYFFETHWQVDRRAVSEAMLEMQAGSASSILQTTA